MNEHGMAAWTTGAVLVVAMAAGGARAQFLPPGGFAPPDPGTSRRPAEISAALAAAPATAQKLRTGVVSWTATVRISPLLTVTADVLQAPEGRRVTYRARGVGDVVQELASVVELPDAWYVVDGITRRKHRPFEADFAAFYLPFVRELGVARVITEGDAARVGKLVTREGAVARFSVPLPDVAEVKVLLTYLEAERRAAAGGPQEQRLWQRQIDAARRRADAGGILGVDTKTGLLTEFPGSRWSVKVTDVAFLPKLPDGVLKVDPAGWQDCMGDLADGGPAGAPATPPATPPAGAKPGEKPADTPAAVPLEWWAVLGRYTSGREWEGTPPVTDSALVHLKTGAVRRVAYRGPAAVPGCFTRGRTGVIVCGLDAFEPGHRLCEIDLHTLANRYLGEGIPTGHLFTPALSPDGRTIAVLQKAAPLRAVPGQVYLVDLASGRARPLGQPGLLGYLNWLPDGSGLLLEKYEVPPPGGGRPGPSQLCRMGLDGALVPVREGQQPEVLADGQSILFGLPADGAGRIQRWEVCDLSGGNARPVGNGLPHFQQPSPAPGGGKVLMIGAGSAAAPPQPAIVDLAKGRSEPTAVWGFNWTAPAWR